MEDDEEIIIPPECMEFLQNATYEDIISCFRPAYQEYSHWRIKQIFRDYFGMEVLANYGGYKANRYRDCLTYRVVDIETKTIKAHRLTLYQLRFVIAKYGFPLQEPETVRNLHCEEFLEIIKNL